MYRFCAYHTVFDSESNPQSMDLNDAFAATTDTNRPIFTKVFGDTTTWQTKVGTITFSFVFDPKANYEKSAIMASAWSDPVEEFKKELQRHLLSDEDFAPMASEQEVVWEYIKANVPAELLVKHVASIDEYMTMLEARAKKEYHELVAFTDALKTRAFDFAVQVAIDAYPVPKEKRRGSGRKSPAVEENGGPRGVCILHVQHELRDESEAASRGGPSAMTLAPPSAAAGDETSSPRLRERSLSNASQESADFASTNLGASLELGDAVALRTAKKFPRDAADFFAQVEAWLQATIKKRTQELVEAASMSSTLYN
ncbi:uncharacterized protein AMSG_10245 [Thecamonas trahens ATCC 50062]|uniref:Uncharacterized protein n=1 Tax=Thecamonas trahens ATCC 50062 TaxID=461836 RepID=A0A0L0DRX7_THETB|nr:hypothetical protein AMSG_10245 [Thecamonas trahens ATCC 50062]KNC54997.1 hypothetical protein AMSG_10245 [Thecamonas trahens ATCC 50062]|eukprot:XP_013753441.1 hypothetical protein AMSG_10245 [Thecamonas trahens ATCC 50062]